MTLLVWDFDGTLVDSRPLIEAGMAHTLDRLGLDPNNLSYFFGGLDQKLVGVEPVEPIKKIMA